MFSVESALPYTISTIAFVIVYSQSPAASNALFPVVAQIDVSPTMVASMLQAVLILLPHIAGAKPPPYLMATGKRQSSWRDIRPSLRTPRT
jgi:hypothetical protein